MKLIAKTKDGDIFEVKLQRQFPNCGKYTKCCIDDKEYWEKYVKLVNGLVAEYDESDRKTLIKKSLKIDSSSEGTKIGGKAFPVPKDFDKW